MKLLSKKMSNLAPSKLIIALSVVALSACSTLSKEECLHADWSLLGHQDAIAGNGQDMLSYYRSDCAEFGVTPDLAEYQKGFEQGLNSFCTFESGKSFGLNGGNYKQTCQSHSGGAEFLEGYNKGNGYYQLTSQSDQIKYQQSSISFDIEKLEKEMTKKELALVAGEYTIEERLQLVNDIKNHQGKISELKKTYLDNQVTLGSLSAKIEAYWQ